MQARGEPVGATLGPGEEPEGSLIPALLIMALSFSFSKNKMLVTT